jgi:hypothetical protein
LNKLLVSAVAATAQIEQDAQKTMFTIPDAGKSIVIELK